MPSSFHPQSQGENDCTVQECCIPEKGVEMKKSSQEDNVSERKRRPFLWEMKKYNFFSHSFTVDHIFLLSVHLDDNQPHYKSYSHYLKQTFSCTSK